MHAYYIAREGNPDDYYHEDFVTKCDFGNGTATNMPHYMWDNCSAVQHCLIVRGEDSHVPSLYNVYNHSKLEYGTNALTTKWRSNTRTRGDYAIMTRKGILTDSAIYAIHWRCMSDYYVNNKKSTTDYYTGDLSMAANSCNKSTVFTERLHHIEQAELAIRPHTHNVFGPIIYYYTPIGMFCNDMRTGDNTHIFEDVWTRDNSTVVGHIYYSSRAFTECIIGILRIITGIGSGESATNTHAFADMFDTRWPIGWAAQCPPIQLPHNTDAIRGVAIGSFCKFE